MLQLRFVSLAGLLALAVSCRSGSASPTAQPSVTPRPAAASGNITGAPDPRRAVQEFLEAANSDDLQAMGAIWGTKDGPARDNGVMSREELEKRELILRCYFRQDTYRILSDAPAPNGGRVLAVELTRRGLTRSANFYAVAGPGGRWYVLNADMEPLREFCAQR